MMVKALCYLAVFGQGMVLLGVEWGLILICGVSK